MTTVVVTQNRKDIAAAIVDALGHLPLERLVRGKLVAVKPNETWATREDTSAVTHGDTLRAVLRAVKRFEPRELVVTGGAGAAETEDVFRYSGMLDVVRQEHVGFFDHNRPPFVEVPLEYAPARDVQGPQRSVMVNPRVLEYETLIAVNQLKLHRTATVTMALKNIAMSYPAADYYGHPRVLEYETLIAVNQLKLHRTATVTMALKNIAMSYPAADYYGHPRSKEKHQHEFYDDMHSFIAAMAKRFPISLAITVGHPAMIATGPTGGIPVETGMVIASTDAVAADCVGARLLGFSAQAVRYLWEAGKLGLGETDIEKIDFPALSFEDAAKGFTEAAYGHAVTLKGA